MMCGFICGDCGAGEHGKCRGGTWCDCQHKEPSKSVQRRMKIMKGEAND